ncbi:hypothetical protein KI387_026127, partial [Taxus chinensis]
MIEKIDETMIRLEMQINSMTLNLQSKEEEVTLFKRELFDASNKEKSFQKFEKSTKDLDDCGVKVSEGLIEQVFKKFSTDWSSALGFFKWAGSQPGYRHTQEAYNTMVDILGKMKQFQEMWKLVEEMKLVGGLISLRTFTKVIRRYGGAEKWEEAIRAFNEMEEFGIEMDTAAMNVLLDVLCKEKTAEHVWDVFVDFKDKIPPDAHTFNALIHGWCKAKKFEEAEWTMEEMR